MKINKSKIPALSTFFNSLHNEQMFSMTSVSGYQGVGKSQYALKVLGGVFGEKANCEWETDWDEVLKHTFFSLKPAFKMLKEVRGTKDRAKAILLDDIGVHASRYTSFLKGGWSLIDAVNSMIDLIRESVWGGALLTSPDEDTIKVLRDKSWLFTYVKWYKTYQGFHIPREKRVCITYQKKVRPDKKVVTPIFRTDLIKINSIPSDVLTQYYDMKTEASAMVLDKAYEKIAEMEDSAFKTNDSTQMLEQVKRLDKLGLTQEKIALALTGKADPTWARRKLIEVNATN